MATPTTSRANELSHTYLSPEQVARMLPGITTARLAMWRYEGKGPKFRKAGRSVLYALDEVEAWIESTVRQSTSDDDW
ncbi:helix-turn-helix transcriptional regulator [Microbacterium immunditiarum]|uniref:Putative DNA-binding transcriptional regulator AlpA n=1 Tax=Microbacterium immunditiarum TaxID=337480 RepID=A0A7Y9KJU0_9MICO|nr:helix-turn-helix domain-containing protein [Microbacterium immunditiarum]NYE18114.1 putative DNA-binding transcriptional regulator AlpA [Microbacterium immunditiarum]